MSHPPVLTVCFAGWACIASIDVVGQESAIEEILVTGRAQQYYLDDKTTAGSKLDLDVIDLPQSVQVLTEQLIIDQAARNITDLYRSMAGVSEFSYSGVTIRGFRESDNVYYNGVRGDPYSGFSVPQLFNVEKVEVLKGPTASLYGGGEPGGLINYVTKKPSFEQETNIALTAGNYGLYGGQVDVTGGATERVAYRVGAFFEEQNDFRNNGTSENRLVSGSLLFDLGLSTNLTAAVDYVDQDLGGSRQRGVPARDNGDFIVDRSYSVNEEDDFQSLEALVAQVTLNHEFSDTQLLKVTTRYLENTRTQGYHEPRGWIDVNDDGVADENDGVVLREYRDQNRENEEYSITLDFIQSFTLFNTQHQLLLGADHHYIDADFDFRIAPAIAGNAPPLDVYALNYGEADPSVYSYFDLPLSATTSKVYGLYLQDRIVFSEAWSLMLGLRYDNFDDSSNLEDDEFSQDNVASRFGLVYKVAPNASVYLSYGESFQRIGLGRQLDPDDPGGLDPETGDQWELGWKHIWLDGQLLSTAAVYLINKQDVPQLNPDDTGPNDGVPELINLGEVQSKGFELTLVGDITSHWTLTGNYAWNETEIKEGSSISGSFDGSRFANAPKHQVGVWTRYDISAIASSASIGLDYVSEQFSVSGQRVKPYSVLDASWTTSWDSFTAQLNVNNILDETYAVSGLDERNGLFPGRPREIVMQLRYAL